MKLKHDKDKDLVGDGVFILWSHIEYVHISDLTFDVNRQAVYHNNKHPKKLMTNNSFLSAYKDCLVARCKV